MINPEEDLRIAVTLIHQFENSGIPVSPQTQISAGVYELADRIINRLRRNLTDAEGYNNEMFISMMQSIGYPVLFLVNDLYSCRLFGVQTTKGIIVIPNTTVKC